MDKQGYLRLVITGVVEDINLEEKIIRLNNEEEVVDVKMILENDIKQMVCGQAIKLYIKIRADIPDDDLEIQGYLDKSERDFIAQFELHEDGFGVGPKGAASIYETLTAKGMSMKDICFEVSIGNYSVLEGVPGVGAKTAHKIINTLKDVITVGENSSILVNDNGQISEAVDTLKTLGFVQSDIDNVLSQINVNTEMQAIDIVQAAIEALQS